MMIRGCLLLGMAVCLFQGAAPAAEFLTPPFLQNVKTGGITIMWEMDEEVTAAVEYGTSDAYGQSAPAAAADSGHETYIYKAIVTGLDAGTDYHFRTVIGGKAYGADRVFTTAPAAPRPFSFGVWSDSQGANAAANPADPLEPTKAMMAHMAASGIDIALTCGDLAENGSSYEDTRRFFLGRVAQFLGQTIPYFCAWGNHESNPNGVLRRFADMPSKEREGFGPGFGSFSFGYSGCHFVCIDNATMDNDIINWLESDLQSEASQNAKFRFLFIHVPPYCELWIDGSTTLRDKLVPLLEKYKVDACFSGHTHEYERGYKNHVHYVITGGGSWLDHGEPVVKDWTHMFVGGAHDLAEFEHGLVNEYVKVDVDTGSWQANMHAFQPDGTYIGVRDSFGSTVVDTDGDGLPDEQEAVLGSNPESTDSDGDQLSDYQEAFVLETNPAEADTDGDGLSDHEELNRDGDPNTHAPGTDTNPAEADTDGDGLSDGDEVAAGTDPLEGPPAIFEEDFDGLESSLRPAQDEDIPASTLGWTHTAPKGWTIDNSAMPAQGVAEWQGWSFATPEFWAASDAQGRGEFGRASGVLAAADCDEWDDQNAPSHEGNFDSTLISPSIRVLAGQEIVLQFDNDFRHEANQTGDVLYSFDGGEDQVLVRYGGASGSSRNQRVSLEIPAPRESASLTIKWRLYNAGNNWWWAIDNVVLMGKDAAQRGESPFGGKRAVVIGIDGCRVDSFLAANTPAMDALGQRGAHSHQAIASLGQPTSSGPNWSSILTGVWYEKHGVRDNEFESPNYEAYPHFFRRIKEAQGGAYLSSIVHWAPINEHILSDYDFALQGLSDENVKTRAVEHIQKIGPDVLFLHFDELDGAGHAGGYQPENENYIGAIERIDGYIAEIVAAAGAREEANPGEDWLILVVSDHGGTDGGSHGGLTEEEVRVPFMADSDASCGGALSGDVHIVDVMPTVLRHLGVPVKETWGLDGKAQGFGDCGAP